MIQDRWSEIDKYICSRLVPADPALEAALRASEAAGLPPHNIAPNQGKLLYILAKLQRARNILEIGTLGGYSTIWLGRGLWGRGRLVTFEANPAYAEVARSNITNAGLSEVVDLRVGPALDLLPELASKAFEPFDLTFIDADKQNNPEYFAWALKLSRPGSVIIVDNVVRNGEILNAEGDASVQGVRLLFDKLFVEEGVEATAIQTVGSKGHDGFAIMIVAED